jgi:predicted transcriptional regulator
MGHGTDQTKKPSAGRESMSAEEQGPNRSILLYNDEKILCLICGNEYRDLGVHLQSHGITRKAYKKKYELSDDFPLIAKNTLAKRPNQNHQARTTIPEPHEIASTQADLERLQKHLKTRGEGDPAVPIDLSVSKKGYISLYDGRRIKQLCRYLQKQKKTTFERYAEEFGLPKEYPRHLSNAKVFEDFLPALRETERQRVQAKAEGKSWPPSAEGAAPLEQRVSKIRERRRARSEKAWVRSSRRTKPST